MIWRFAVPSGLAGLSYGAVPLAGDGLCVPLTRRPRAGGISARSRIKYGLRCSSCLQLLNAVSFSVLSQLKGRNENGGYRRIFWSNLAINAGFSTMASFVLIAFSEPLLHVYGREFGGVGWLRHSPCISHTGVARDESYQLIQSAGRMWYSLFAIVIPRDLIYVTVSVVVISRLGLVGAGVSYLIAWVTALILILVSVRKNL